jgi:hypothetical protein
VPLEDSDGEGRSLFIAVKHEGLVRCHRKYLVGLERYWGVRGTRLNLSKRCQLTAQLVVDFFYLDLQVDGVGCVPLFSRQRKHRRIIHVLALHK